MVVQDGCIICPSTESTFDLKTGEVKEWYPKNPVLRVLTPSLRNLFVYSVKTDDENIYIGLGGGGRSEGISAEIVFSGQAQPGLTATDVNVEEVRAASYIGALHTITHLFIFNCLWLMADLSNRFEWWSTRAWVGLDLQKRMRF